MASYGETSWRGINKLLLEGKSIYASAARMNEFYFGTNDVDQRQYSTSDGLCIYNVVCILNGLSHIICFLFVFTF